MKNGFTLLLNPSLNYSNYLQSNFAKRNVNEIQKLRSFFINNNPCKHKGISRNPFNSFPFYWDNSIKIKPDMNIAEFDNIEARRLFCQNCSNYSQDDFDLDMIDNKTAILSVHELIKNKTDYEPTYCFIAEQNDSFIGNFLGYDIGYWGEDHFSIIYDSFLAPLWHPPHENDWPLIKKQISSLNENQLFPTIESSIEFRKMYKSRKWAETESFNGQFCIIGICELTEK